MSAADSLTPLDAVAIGAVFGAVVAVLVVLAAGGGAWWVIARRGRTRDPLQPDPFIAQQRLQQAEFIGRRFAEETGNPERAAAFASVATAMADGADTLRTGARGRRRGSR